MIDRFLRKLSVRTRIVGGFLILIVLLTVSVPVSVANYNFLVERLRQVTNIEATANRALLLASTRIANSRVNLMRYIDNQVPGPTEALDDADTATSLLTDALEQGLISAPSQQQEVATVVQALAEYKTLITDIEAARQQNPDQDNARQIFQAYRLGNDSGQRIEQIVKDSEDRITAANASVESDAQGRIWFLTGSYLVALLLGLTLTLLIQRSITRPIASLRNAAEAFRQGQLDTTIAVTGADELSLLAQTFNQMANQLRDLIGSLEIRVKLHTAQVRASADVGKAATSELDPDRLLNQVVNLIAERFGLYYAAIFTLDRSGTYLVLREATGEAGRTLKERGYRLRVSMDSMVGYAALRHEPRVVMNVSEDTARFANPLLPDAQSEVALPLIVGQEVIGALDVQSTHLNAFDESMLTALQAMASQVAVALQNAQSFQSLQKTLDYTTRQYELSRNIFLAQTPNEAYLTVGQAFAMFAEVDRIQLLRVIDRDANNQPAVYELAIEWDILSGAQMDTGASYAAAETPLAALVAEDEAVVIRDASDARLPAATRERLAQVNAQAIILVPLLIGAEYSGFVAAISEQPREFTESEVRLLKSTAEQLGVVLANLQLTAEMRTTVERVALLNRRLSGEAWDSYRAGRAQLRVESGHVEFATPEHQLQVPIVVRGETIGAFNVADNNLERSWTDDELSLLQTIAGEVALAIDNARLIEQTQRTAQREKDVANVADKIHRSINLEAILHTAMEEVMRIAGTTEVAIQFGQPVALAGNGQQATPS